jgi:Lrp/AsnC family transcriptional regulator for asnA, asnC and gidA
VEVDQLGASDSAITKELHRDGRAVSRDRRGDWAAARQRLQRDIRIINIVAVTDPKQLGLARHAMVGIEASNDRRVIAKKLAAVEVAICTGRFDLPVGLACVDGWELADPRRPGSPPR